MFQHADGIDSKIYLLYGVRNSLASRLIEDLYEMNKNKNKENKLYKNYRSAYTNKIKDNFKNIIPLDD